MWTGNQQWTYCLITGLVRNSVSISQHVIANSLIERKIGRGKVEGQRWSETAWIFSRRSTYKGKIQPVNKQRPVVSCTFFHLDSLLISQLSWEFSGHVINASQNSPDSTFKALPCVPQQLTTSQREVLACAPALAECFLKKF